MFHPKGPSSRNKSIAYTGRKGSANGSWTWGTKLILVTDIIVTKQIIANYQVEKSNYFNKHILLAITLCNFYQLLQLGIQHSFFQQNWSLLKQIHFPQLFFFFFFHFCNNNFALSHSMIGGNLDNKDRQSFNQ